MHQYVSCNAKIAELQQVELPDVDKGSRYSKACVFSHKIEKLF